MSRRTCPKNCWCDCHDKKPERMRITERMRFSALQKLAHWTPIHIGMGRRRRTVGFAWRIIVPKSGAQSVKQALDAAIRADRRAKAKGSVGPLMRRIPHCHGSHCDEEVAS